ncbi:hypothetical protein LLS47_03565 [Rouxiella badensis]|uniref:hypothetical protein n=1 Tax=Rouxiella badensis TaxID=1646377 RepID=UPI001D14F755|nr:hypothetical protein [Rouxiella badensis]MCC3732019.1 hypothetical protein [Rouxiella badensis]MCC3757408.1 hypothetical protein [Rouxiella badensis]
MLKKQIVIIKVENIATGDELKARQRENIESQDKGYLIHKTGGLQKSLNGDWLSGEKWKCASDLFYGT